MRKQNIGGVPTPPVWWPAIIPYPPTLMWWNNAADVTALQQRVKVAKSSVQACVEGCSAKLSDADRATVVAELMPKWVIA